jgi:quercetin dioxygenase-like cupin family protein
MKDHFVNKADVESIQMVEGIQRKTLIFNGDVMMCHFILKKGSKIPLHQHDQHQIGYIIKGKVKFFNDEGESIAKEGESYLFNSNEKHGAIAIEESEVIDVFNPSRTDYI